MTYRLKEALEILIEIITLDIFIGYGFLSLLIILLNLFKSHIRVVHQVDYGANKIVPLAGILYAAALILWILISAPANNNASFLFRGLAWIQPLIWFAMSQILWIKWVKKQMFIRFFISLLFILSIERYVILATSIHRDYYPLSWGTVPINSWILGLTVKIIFFAVIAYAWFIFETRFSTLKHTKDN